MLQNAMNATACKAKSLLCPFDCSAQASGKQFSSTVLRYLCSWSLDVFCEKEVTQTFARPPLPTAVFPWVQVYEHPEAHEKDSTCRLRLQDTQAYGRNRLYTSGALGLRSGSLPRECRCSAPCVLLQACVTSTRWAHRRRSR